MSIPTESVSVNPLRIPDMGVASEILRKFCILTQGIFITGCAGRTTITAASSG